MTRAHRSWRSLFEAESPDGGRGFDPRGIAEAAAGAIKGVSLVVERRTRRDPRRAQDGSAFRTMTYVNRRTGHRRWFPPGGTIRAPTAHEPVCFAHGRPVFTGPCSHHESETRKMIRRGIEFTLVEAQPGLWRWSFQIGETVRTGKTETNLRGMAAHRVQQRIDQELRKPRVLASSYSAS